MTILQADLDEALRIHAPEGVELPRAADNTVSDVTLARWAADAAGMINARRRKTTLKETEITLVEDTQLYDLPAEAREVESIRRDTAAPGSSSEILSIPVSDTISGIGRFGMLPSGQEVDMAVDLIQRTRIERVRREDEFELFGGQIRFLFPIVAGEKIVVRYNEVDRGLATVPDDRFEDILTYMRFKLLEWFIGKNGVGTMIDADRFGPDGMAALVRQKMDLERHWTAKLNGIGPEAA